MQSVAHRRLKDSL